MYNLYAESISLEIQEMFESFDTEIEIAKYMYYECQGETAGRYFREAQKEEESEGGGGLVGLLKNILKGVSNLLKSAGDKFQKLVFGSKVKEERANDRINVDKDPNLLTKFLNGDIKSSTDMLMRAAKGEVSVDEAKGFVQKQNSAYAGIKGAALTATAMFGTFVANKKYLDKWKEEADRTLNTVENTSGTIFSSKVANQYNDDNKKAAAKEAVNIIISHIQSSNKKGLEGLLEPIKRMYQENYLNAKIMKDAERSTTREGVREMKKEEKQKTKAEIDEQKRIDKEAKNRKEAQKVKGRFGLGRYAERQKTEQKIKDNYADTKDRYVDTDAINAYEGQKKRSRWSFK